MFGFETEKYLVRLLDKNNKKELEDVQRLRYEFLLKDFNSSLEGTDLDDDGYDEFADSILVIDKSNGVIAGVYRVATSKTIKDQKYKLESEFDISDIKNNPDGIIEASRAVVRNSYRDGDVLGLLWKGLFSYGEEFGLRYIIGTVSLHGTDPSQYERCTSLLREKFVSKDFKISALANSFEYGNIVGVGNNDSNIPPLLKGYLFFLGAKLSINGFIDYEFNSCDVLIIVDLKSINPRHVRYLLG